MDRYVRYLQLSVTYLLQYCTMSVIVLFISAAYLLLCLHIFDRYVGTSFKYLQSICENVTNVDEQKVSWKLRTHLLSLYANHDI